MNIIKEDGFTVGELIDALKRLDPYAESMLWVKTMQSPSLKLVMGENGYPLVIRETCNG